MILYSIHGSAHDPFDLFDTVRTVYRAEEMKEEKGVVLLHGGADISPSFYNQSPIEYCYASREPSQRDVLEAAAAQYAIKRGWPIIGICRGAQLLCALDGGYLIQHVVGHTQGHTIKDTETGIKLTTTSAHHQMMVPQEHNKILSISLEKVKGYDKDEKEIIFENCPETVYFPHINAIGFQGHPEWAYKTPYQLYCSSLINKYLLSV